MDTAAQPAPERPLRLSLSTLAPTLSAVYLYVGLALLFALVFLDFLDLRFPAAGALGTMLWFVSYAYVAVFASLCLYKVLFVPKILAAPFTATLLLIVAIVLVVNVTDPRNVSGETSIETGCAMTQLTQAPDRGFQKTCLFGYPVRQQFLPALPSLIFGRNQLDLNLGGSLYFLLAVIIFAGCAVEFLRYSRTGDILAALLIATLFHIYYFDHFLLLGEQSVFPLCFGLILAGLVLRYLTHHDQVSIVLCGFVLLYLVASYTPSLSLFFLCLVALGYFVVRERRREETLLMGLVGVLGLASLRLSLLYRQDIHLTDTGTRSIALLVGDLRDALDHILFASHGVPFISPVMTFPFLMIMFAALGMLFGWEAAAVALWAVATIVLAVVSKGYEYYPIDFRLHRAMIIFPVLCALVAIVWSHSKWRPRIEYLSLATVVIVFSGLIFLFDYRNSVPVNAHAVFGEWLQSHVRNASTPTATPRTLWLIGSADNAAYISLNDEMTYFDPGLHMLPFQQAAFGSHCAVTSDLAGVFVVPTNNRCFETFAGARGRRGRFVDDGRFPAYHGQVFGVFERT